MQYESLVYDLHRIGVIQFGEFTLKSGQTSPIYLNLRKIISYPDLLRQVAKAMEEKTKSCTFDLVCGVPYTALPIATCISIDLNVPMVMRRKEKKDYGTKQMIEGEFKPQQRCLLIEDVITTGSSLLETAHDLEKTGLKVNDMVVLIDREQGAVENLKNYQVHSIFSITDMLNTLLNSNRLRPEERHSIHQFLKERLAS